MGPFNADEVMSMAGRKGKPSPRWSVFILFSASLSAVLLLSLMSCPGCRVSREEQTPVGRVEEMASGEVVRVLVFTQPG